MYSCLCGFEKPFGRASRLSNCQNRTAKSGCARKSGPDRSPSTHLVVTKLLHCVRIIDAREILVTSRPLSTVEQSPDNPVQISEEPSIQLEPPRKYPGALIVVEGIDGSGKSTQLYLLKRWLEIGGYRLHFTEWNSSPLVKSATRRGKQRRLLTPTTFSLLHAADFADRCERQILPLLHSGYLVLADRYIYTAFARDAARNCSTRWLRNLYRFAPVPDITFYFRAPLDGAVKRIMSGRPKLKYYEAGMDLNLSLDRAESFRIFQGRILAQYDEMIESDKFVVMDGTLPVNSLQKQMRQMVKARIDLARFAPKKSARRAL
jgi:dTMP kinase